MRPTIIPLRSFVEVTAGQLAGRVGLVAASGPNEVLIESQLGGFDWIAIGDIWPI